MKKSELRQMIREELLKEAKTSAILTKEMKKLDSILKAAIPKFEKEFSKALDKSDWQNKDFIYNEGFKPLEQWSALIIDKMGGLIRFIKQHEK